MLEIGEASPKDFPKLKKIAVREIGNIDLGTDGNDKFPELFARLRSFLESSGISVAAVFKARKEKDRERGGFSGRCVLVNTIEKGQERNWNKLVRDKIPQIIEENGGTANYFIEEDDAEFLLRLQDKIREEIEELRETKSFKDFVDELADLWEVLELEEEQRRSVC